MVIDTLQQGNSYHKIMILVFLIAEDKYKQTCSFCFV